MTGGRVAASTCECCGESPAPPRHTVDGDVANICDECMIELQRGDWMLTPGAAEA